MKTVIDLDAELTEAAAKVLGTTTKKDTIHAALAAAVAEAERNAERRTRLLNSARPRPCRRRGHVPRLVMTEVYPIDKSAPRAPRRQPTVRAALEYLDKNGVLAASAIIELEVGYGARNLAELYIARTLGLVGGKGVPPASTATTTQPPATPAPTPTPSPTTQTTYSGVHPGAFCSQHWAYGRTSAGTLMRCTTTRPTAGSAGGPPERTCPRPAPTPQ